MKNLWWAGLGLAVLVAGGCSPSKQDVATVNGKEITKDQLSQRLLQTPTAKQVLQEMLLSNIIQDAAAKKGIKITDEQVNQAIQANKDQYPPGRFEEVNAANGMNDAVIREQVRTELALRALETQGAKINDADIKKFYDQNTVAVTKPEWKQVGFIITKDADDAKKAISAIQQGADFATVADKFMIPQAKNPNMMLQWVGIVNNTLINEQRQPVERVQGSIAAYPAVRSAIMKTPEGKVSDPIAPLPSAPQRVLVYVKTRVPSGKMPLDEVKNAISYNIAVQNNQIKPKEQVIADAVKDSKIDIKMPQFADLAKPEVLVPQAPAGAMPPGHP